MVLNIVVCPVLCRHSLQITSSFSATCNSTPPMLFILEPPPPPITVVFFVWSELTTWLLVMSQFSHNCQCAFTVALKTSTSCVFDSSLFWADDVLKQINIRHQPVLVTFSWYCLRLSCGTAQRNLLHVFLSRLPRITACNPPVWIPDLCSNALC